MKSTFFAGLFLFLLHSICANGQQVAAIHVADARANPVANAQVIIGSETLTTDANGDIVVPTEWKSIEDIVIRKDGYIPAVYLQQAPASHGYEIHQAKPETPYKIQGTNSGFGDLSDDGYVKFAINMTSLSNSDLLNFDIANVISPQSDDITEMGYTLHIPSNVFLPQQDVSYGFVPLTIAKASYTLLTSDQGDFHVQSNSARFKFKTVLGEIRSGKSFFEVVNDFEFLSVGTQDVQLNGSSANLDIDINTRPLTQKIPFTTINPVPTSMLYGISLFKDSRNYFVGDVKLRDSTPSQSLAVPADSTNNSVLLVLTDKDPAANTQQLSNNFSSAIVTAANVGNATLLDRVPAPQISGNSLEIQKPTAKDHIQEFATYITLSKVEKSTQGKYTVERKTPMLEIYANNWIDSYDFSNAPVAAESGMRWDVTFFGIDSAHRKSSNELASFLSSQLNPATHAVHNAVDVP